MRKVRISFEETAQFRRKFTIEVPEGIDENSLNAIFDTVEERNNFSEEAIIDLEENFGCKVLLAYDSGYEKPLKGNIKIDDYKFLKSNRI